MDRTSNGADSIAGRIPYAGASPGSATRLARRISERKPKPLRQEHTAAKRTATGAGD